MDGREARSAKSTKERRLFDDALSFKIRTGLTVRIPSSQNQFAAFTLAVDDRSLGLDRFIETSQDMLETVALNYHAHVSARIGRASIVGGWKAHSHSANGSVSLGSLMARRCRILRRFSVLNREA